MTRGTEIGEALSGRYFWCSDALIVKEPGVLPTAKVIMGLLDDGEFHQVFQRLDRLRSGSHMLPAMSTKRE
jgi:hypothetical protein